MADKNSKSMLHVYYTGILQRLRSEVDLLNEIIPHNLTKGMANEDSLKAIIKSFIPQTYGVGSGIIIDSFGGVSRQVDLIIYDKISYPNLFSQTIPVIYPIETVIAAIEVKTYLDGTKLKEVFENGKSIRKLRHYVEKLTVNKPSPEFPVHLIEFETKPPTTHLLAYRVDSEDLNTWKKRYFDYPDTEFIPDTSLLLDIASVFYFTDVDKRTKADLKYGFCPIRAMDVGAEGPPHAYVHCNKEKEPVVHNGIRYTSAKFLKDGFYPILMPERAFLSFLLRLNHALDIWPRHQTFDPSKYVDANYTATHEL